MIIFSANTKAKSADVDQNFTDLSNGTGDVTANSLATTRKIAMPSFVASGLVLPTSASLSSTLPAGVAVVNGKYLAPTATVITVTASKDTYIYLKDDGTISFTGSQSVANGAAAPTAPTNSDGTNQMLVGMAVSNGTAITSVTQFGSDSLGHIYYPQGAGSVALSQNPYKFSVARTAAYLTIAGTFTKLPFDTKTFDSGNNFDVLTNNRFTAPVSGYYYFNARLDVVNTRVILALYKNGSPIKRGPDITVASSQVGACLATSLPLVAGDYVELWYFTAAANNISLAASQSFFDGELRSVS